MVHVLLMHMLKQICPCNILSQADGLLEYGFWHDFMEPAVLTEASVRGKNTPAFLRPVGHGISRWILYFIGVRVCYMFSLASS